MDERLGPIRRGDGGKRVLADHNPFYVPLDEDIFKVKEEERMAKKLMRKENLSKKIWEKGVGSYGGVQTGGHKANIKQDIKTIMTEVSHEEMQPKKEVGLIEAADRALKNRVGQREQMQKFIEKKREMFLMQMTIDQKKEQIKQLEELTALKTQGLQKAEQYINQDLMRFNSHLKTQKDNANNATKKAAQKADEKNKASKLLKELQEKKATEISLNAKELERINALFDYKIFLDNMAEHTNSNIENAKIKARVDEMLDKRPGDYINIRDYIDFAFKEELDHLVNDPVDYYQPAFKTPEDILKKFLEMEENTLKLIRAKQDSETERADLSEQLVEMEEQYKLEIALLEQKKERIAKSIQEKTKTLAELEKISHVGTLEIEKDQKKISEGILAVRKIFDSSNTQSNPIADMTRLEQFVKERFEALAILAAKNPEKLAEGLREYKEHKKRKAQELERIEKDTKRRGQAESSMNLEETKVLKRPVMTRSYLPKKERNTNKDQDVDPEIELNKKYFRFEDMSK